MAVFSKGMDPLPETPTEAAKAIYRELAYMREAIEFNNTQVLRKIRAAGATAPELPPEEQGKVMNHRLNNLEHTE